MPPLRDMLQAGKLTALAALACATPPPYWRLIAAAGVPRHPGKRDPCRPLYRRALGMDDDRALDALCARRWICRNEAKMQVLGLAGPWRGWRPRIRREGEEHLRAALAAGHGAILWPSAFVYNHLVFKIALHQAGYRATQLSRPSHGFARSPIAVRFFNPVWMRVENRFLRERILIRDDRTGPAMRTLRTRLADNGVVVITVSNEAVRTVAVPLLGHWICLPTGPVNLAQSSGAPLLPAFVVRNAEGVYEVTIEAALPVPPPGAERDDFSGVVAALARRIEHYVRLYPEQWGGWSGFLVKEVPARPQAAGGAAKAAGPTGRAADATAARTESRDAYEHPDARERGPPRAATHREQAGGARRRSSSRRP